MREQISRLVREACPQWARLRADIRGQRRRREAAERLAGWRTLWTELAADADEATPAGVAPVRRLVDGRPLRLEVDEGAVGLMVGPAGAEKAAGLLAAIGEWLATP